MNCIPIFPKLPLCICLLLVFFIETVNTKIKHDLSILCAVLWHGALALLIVESLNEGEDNVYLIYVAALIENSEEALERKNKNDIEIWDRLYRYN